MKMEFQQIMAAIDNYFTLAKCDPTNIAKYYNQAMGAAEFYQYVTQDPEVYDLWEKSWKPLFNFIAEQEGVVL